MVGAGHLYIGVVRALMIVGFLVARLYWLGLQEPRTLRRPVKRPLFIWVVSLFYGRAILVYRSICFIPAAAGAVSDEMALPLALEACFAS